MQPQGTQIGATMSGSAPGAQILITLFRAHRSLSTAPFSTFAKAYRTHAERGQATSKVYPNPDAKQWVLGPPRPAPRATAFIMCPTLLMPPSAITGIPNLAAYFATRYTAINQRQKVARLEHERGKKTTEQRGGGGKHRTNPNVNKIEVYEQRLRQSCGKGLDKT